ncbi:MAG: cupin domain-containing protein [Gammaproteobacteria bacterium]|nr:cupin domain-containing protein [Gammaproteobacteria bacterium]
MSKSTITYFNALKSENEDKWEILEDSDGLIEFLTLAMDEETGDYTRLTRFKKGADTKAFGTTSHTYPEEVFIVTGRLYDAAFDQWLEQGDYASRPPGEVHGHFIAEEECVVLEVSFPSQSI